MKPSRRLMVYAWLAILIVGHSVAIIDKSELWPFSPYRLYSRLYRSDPHHVMMLYGVSADGSETRLSAAHFQPIDRGRLHRVLNRTLHGSTTQDEFHDRLIAWAALYEGKRQQLGHDGPQLVGMRLYVERHFFRADVANRYTPDERELKGQVFLGGHEPTLVPFDVLRRGKGWYAGRWIGRFEEEPSVSDQAVAGVDGKELD